MKRILRRWRWIVAGLAVVLVGTLGSGWLMFEHIPAWYQPMRIAPADHQRVRDSLSDTYTLVETQLAGTRVPFKVRLTQDQINAWLSCREAFDPKTREWFPPVIQDPMILLEKDGVRVAATYCDGGLSTVISARLTIHAEANGIRTRLEEVSGGSLGVPDFLIRPALEAFDKQAASRGDSGFFEPQRSRPRLVNLLEGIVWPNRAVWPGGGRHFRVLDIQLESGAITFALERSNEDHSRR